MGYQIGMIVVQNSKIPSKNIIEDKKEVIMPLTDEGVCMEAFQNIESQTIERFYQNYLQSNGDKKFRIVELGIWTVDIKLLLRMLTD